MVSLAADDSYGVSFTIECPILSSATAAAMQPGAHEGMMVGAANDQGLYANNNALPKNSTPDDAGSDTSQQLSATDLASRLWQASQPWLGLRRRLRASRCRSGCRNSPPPAMSAQTGGSSQA
jgi:hypothetical protein